MNLRGYKFFKGDATTTPTDIDYAIQKINYISNDGNESLFLSLNLRRDIVQKNGLGDQIEIKAGEVLNNLDIDTNQMSIVSATGTVPYRILVVT